MPSKIKSAFFALKKLPEKGRLSVGMKSRYSMTPLSEEAIAAIVSNLRDFYDVLVISSITETLSPSAILVLEGFLAAGGSILWIYDEQFQSFSASFTTGLTFQLLNEREGFHRPAGIPSPLFDDFVDQDIVYTQTYLDTLPMPIFDVANSYYESQWGRQRLWKSLNNKLNAFIDNKYSNVSLENYTIPDDPPGTILTNGVWYYIYSFPPFYERFKVTSSIQTFNYNFYQKNDTDENFNLKGNIIQLQYSIYTCNYEYHAPGGDVFYHFITYKGWYESYCSACICEFNGNYYAFLNKVYTIYTPSYFNPIQVYTYYPIQVYRSIDGGVNWSLVGTCGSTPTTFQYPLVKENSFSTANKIYICWVQRNTLAPYYVTKIYASSNGTSYSEEFSTNTALSDPRFVKYGNDVYITLTYTLSGHHSYVYKNTNEAGTWTLIKTIADHDVYGVEVFKNKLYLLVKQNKTYTPYSIKLMSYDGTTWVDSAYVLNLYGTDYTPFKMFSIGYLLYIYIKHTSGAIYISIFQDMSARRLLTKNSSYDSSEGFLAAFNANMYRLKLTRNVVDPLNITYDMEVGYFNSTSDVMSNISKLQLTWPNKGADLFNPDHGDSYLMSWRNDEQFISLLTAFENVGRFICISDSNLFTNSAPDFDTNNNALLVRNIFRYLGWWDGADILLTRMIWLVNSWLAPKVGWMDIDDVTAWGADTLKSTLQTMGFTITQRKDLIDKFLKYYL